MMIAELDGSFFYLCIGCKDSHCSFHGNGFTGTGLTYDGNCLAFVKVNVDARIACTVPAVVEKVISRSLILRILSSDIENHLTFLLISDQVPHEGRQLQG